LTDISGVANAWEEGDHYVIQVTAQDKDNLFLDLDGRKPAVKSGTEVAIGDVLASNDGLPDRLVSPMAGTAGLTDKQRQGWVTASVVDESERPAGPSPVGGRARVGWSAANREQDRPVNNARVQAARIRRANVERYLDSLANRTTTLIHAEVEERPAGLLPTLDMTRVDFGQAGLGVADGVVMTSGSKSSSRS